MIGQKLQVILTKLKLHGELQVDLKLGKPQMHIKDTFIPTCERSLNVHMQYNVPTFLFAFNFISSLEFLEELRSE